MIDLQEATQQRYDELIEYLQEAPIDVSSEMYFDNLWGLCHAAVIDELTSEAEARRDELKEESYNEPD